MTRSALGPGGEFDRIRRVIAALGPLAPDVGDDCAVLPEGSGRVVLSTDLSIQGVHFDTAWLSFEEIGWRAASGALSDLAAGGADPVGLLASVAAPRRAAEGQLVDLMRGIGAAIGATGGVFLGGDLSAGPQWIVDVTVVGRAERPARRRGAMPGDGLWVTGLLGLPRAALAAWRRGEQPEPGARRAFAHPEPRIAMGKALTAAGARAMLDLSDGLGGDAGHLAAASGVRLEIDLDRLPVAPAVARMAALAGEPAGIFAAGGGEDYELLAALPPGFGAAEAAALTSQTGVRLTRIGEIREGEGVRMILGGRPVRPQGYDHFA